MPIGETITETGLLLADGRQFILQRPDGGRWRLEIGMREGRGKVGKKVRVVADRDGFDLLYVREIEEV
jgi:hypothetical protein